MGKLCFAKTKTKRERCHLKNLPRTCWITYIVYPSKGINSLVIFFVVYYYNYLDLHKIYTQGKQNFFKKVNLFFFNYNNFIWNILPERFVFTFHTPLFGTPPRSMAKQKSPILCHGNKKQIKKIFKLKSGIHKQSWIHKARHSGDDWIE